MPVPALLSGQVKINPATSIAGASKGQFGTYFVVLVGVRMKPVSG
jgi:hypothetical protein